MAATPTVKSLLGRALRETGAAMKEAGRAEVRIFINNVSTFLDRFQ
jgi:hypothetical protein